MKSAVTSGLDLAHNEKNKLNTGQLNEQVAPLWQRDRAKLDMFLIKVQSYSQNHALNCIFWPPYGGIGGNINAFLKALTKTNFVAEFYQPNVSFTLKTAN